MGKFQFSPGSLFADRFEIQRAAGSGGMGAVYRAADRYSGNTVALKLLHAGAGKAEEAERFLREAQLLSELHHPGIVTYVAHGQTSDGQRFLAMEWLEGNDLGERLTRGPLPVRDCLRLLEQVADALSVAHQRGIIHRDLKPTNLFLVGGDVGRIKILDFGIARRISASRAMTRTGMVVGTPEYMAPEQARGSRDLSPGADLFSLGCVLYECLTGQPPFVADHIAAVLVRILFEDPIPIDDCRPGISAGLSSLLSRLLAKDPTLRLADAAELRTELSRLGEQPEPALAMTMAGEKPIAEHFALQEQKLFSIVLAASPDEDIGFGATQPGSAAQLPETDRRALLQALAALGSSPDFLANGTLVVTVPPLESAQDQATLAARAALLIKERWPEAMVSMATGRGTVRGRTAVGEVVELAARSLESGSQPSGGLPPTGVFIDPLSAKLLAGRFAQTPQPGDALLIHEERDVDASRPLLGKPTPCVGREPELAILETQLLGCIEDSESRVVLFTAPPGAGKSRLRHEFVRRVQKREEPVTIVLGRGDITNAGVPYGILRTALHKLCGISSSESLETQRERLHARVAQHLTGIDAERVILFVGELCSVPFSDDGKPLLRAARQDPKIMHDCLRRAFLDFLAAECAAAPVLLILDDVQWSDALTVSILDTALHELQRAPLFVLSFARTEVHEVFPKLWQNHKPQEIPLQGLSKKACERLIGQVLGKEVAPEAVARAVEQSAGNVLFLEELIRSIAEGNSKAPSETVLAMLQARLSRLDSSVRRAVRAASVFGQTFWRDGVVALLGRSTTTADVQRWLDALRDAEIIQSHAQSRLGGQTEFGFRHSLMCDAAYSLLTDSDLQTGHRHAAEFLEATPEANAATIADHFERGGEKQRAAGHYLRAADENLRIGNYVGTLHWVDQGLQCSPEEALRAKLCSLDSYASLLVGRYDRMAGAAEYAIERLRTGSLGWARVVVGALVVAMSMENMSRGLEIISQAVATEPEEDAYASYIEALNMIFAGTVVSAPGFLMQTIVDKLAASTAHAEVTNPLIRRCLHATRAMLAYRREPRPWTAIVECQRAIAIAKESHDRLIEQANRIIILEYAWLQVGDLEAGRHRVMASEAEAANSQIELVRYHWRHLLACHLCQLADESAWARAEDLVSPLLLGGHRLWPILAKSILAQVALLRGQLAQAEAQASELMQPFPTEWLFLMHGAAIQIHALLGLNRPADATAVAEKVLATFPIFGGAGHAEVEFRIAATEALNAAGNPERAHAELRETLRQIQLRADDISDPFWKNSYLTRNPFCVRAQQLAKEWGIENGVK